MGDFNLPDMNWEYHTEDTNRSRKFLRHVEDNFLVQVLKEPTRKGALLDLLFVKSKGLVGKVVTGGCLGHSDHKVAEFQTVSDREKNCQQNFDPGYGESRLWAAEGARF